MSGIAGKVVFGRDARPPRDAVRAMTDALAHRGSGGSDFHVGPTVSLGHRRSNLGDHATERQPFGNDARTVWVVLDGEVLNARELRHELRGHGRVFGTTSDAEVIVQGYEAWGDRVVERLRGAFAFAVWDSARSRLLLGRDRLGIKPLCYAALDGRGVAFASEPAALLEDPEIPRDWDPASIREYLALGYVPSPATMFRRIVRLAPGHRLTVEHGRVRAVRYWEVSFGEDGSRRSEADFVEHLAELLGRTARMHADATRSTVLLSADAGSAALVASLDAAHVAPFESVTVAFDGTASRGLDRARGIAKHFDSRHHAEVLTLRLGELVPTLARAFDEPVADASAVKAYCLALAARAHAGPGVVLSAAGADEVWAGHRSYHSEQVEARVRRALGPIGVGVGLVGLAVPLPFDVVRAAGHLALPQAEACARCRGASQGPSRAHRLCSPDFLRETRGIDPYRSLREALDACTSRDGLAQALYLDQKTRLVDDVLTRIDRAANAAGVQVRLPMLDHELVEFAAGVPSNLKMRGKQTHYLLRRLLDGRIPNRLLRGRGEPFEARAASWLRGPLAPMASDVLLSGRFRQRGLFDPTTVRRAWQAHLTGRRDYHRELWSLMMLELWFEQFVDGAERRARVA